MHSDYDGALNSYISALQAVPRGLERAYRDLCALDLVPTAGIGLTKSILRTISAYYQVRYETIKILGKQHVGLGGPDAFVEAMLLHLNALVSSCQLPLDVSSERKIAPGRGLLRPDITVWHEEDLVAAIECKNSLSYDRNNWERHFQEREMLIVQRFPRARCFLVVLCNLDAPRLEANSKAGRQYFALSTVWPQNVSLDHPEASVCHPVEPIFEHILSAAAQIGMH